MTPQPTGASWADVALALITFAREDTAIFLLTVIAPLMMTGWGLKRFAGFMGVKRIHQLANTYLERLSKPAPKKLAHDVKQGEGEGP